MSEIRHAVESDIPDIIRMAGRFWEQTDYKVPFDADSALGLIKTCMVQNLCMVLDIDGVRGFVGGISFPLMGNNAYTIGAELAWWVDEEYRSGRNGLILMQAIEDSARESGVHYWSMMNLESVNPEIAETIYLRSGYKKTESTFLKEL